jgi:hypothetical protein
VIDVTSTADVLLMPGMAQSRLPMRKIRGVLRLSAAGLSKPQIAASLGIGPTAAGVPAPGLEAGICPTMSATTRWNTIGIRHLRPRPNVQLVWEKSPIPMATADWFRELYRAWEGRIRAGFWVMQRQAKRKRPAVRCLGGPF